MWPERTGDAGWHTAAPTGGERATGLTPLSVAADRIALTAIRSAALRPRWPTGAGPSTAPEPESSSRSIQRRPCRAGIYLRVGTRGDPIVHTSRGSSRPSRAPRPGSASVNTPRSAPSVTTRSTPWWRHSPAEPRPSQASACRPTRTSGNLARTEGWIALPTRPLSARRGIAAFTLPYREHPRAGQQYGPGTERGAPADHVGAR